MLKVGKILAKETAAAPFSAYRQEEMLLPLSSLAW